jgi:hypothetical protein
MPGHGRRQGSCRPWPILRHQLALLPVLLPKACTFDASDLGGWEPEAISAAAAPPRATARAAAGCPAHPAGRQTTDAQETGAQRPARAPTAPRQGAGARNLRPARQGVQAGALPVGPMVGRALLQRPPSLNPDLRASRVDHIAGHDLTSHQPDHIPEVADLHITAQQRHPIAPAGVQQVALHIRRPAPFPPVQIRALPTTEGRKDLLHPPWAIVQVLDPASLGSVDHPGCLAHPPPRCGAMPARAEPNSHHPRRFTARARTNSQPPLARSPLPQ